ncbi:hypothetical protein CIB48_g4094 [Xylaria polymorpha]|nr:hypothetical protein CIB48_g4094 [Xylaria polymorpha]
MPPSEYKKRIVVCCDGTWQNADSGCVKSSRNKPESKLQVPSNVTRISRCFKRTCSDGVFQIIYYQSGVGSGSGFLDRLFGGAFGTGISENIREAYAFICANYVDGDEIVLLGFSRGAFTARSIGGMVSDLGLLTREGMEYFYPIFKDMQNWSNEQYDDPFPTMPFTNKPKGENAASVYCERLIEKGYSRVKGNNGQGSPIRVLAIGTTGWIQSRVQMLLTLDRRMGHCWITGLTTSTYQFYNTHLSDKIQHGFHALALDETRGPFTPTLWERRQQEQHTSDLRQVWFAGSHKNHLTRKRVNMLEGMMDQLSSVGCQFRPDALERAVEATVNYYMNQEPESALVRCEETCPICPHQTKKPITWAEKTIYELNEPIRPWSLHYIQSATGPLYNLIGSVSRAPGMYKKIDPKSGRPLPEFLEDTNERIHPSVRVRLACEGLGLNDSDVWNCPSLLRFWRPRRVTQQFFDPVSRTADWGPVSGASQPATTAQPSEEAGSSTANRTTGSTESLQMLRPEPSERWVWEYIGPEITAPAVRTMVEENLGPYEQRLLALAAGKVHVYKYAEKQDVNEFKAFHLRNFRKTMKRLHKKWHELEQKAAKAAKHESTNGGLCCGSVDAVITRAGTPTANMLSILRKARLKDKEMRILMLGLDNAGKTTIVKKIMNEDVNTVSPTLGFIIRTIEYEGYKLNIWDVGGQKTLRSYWRNYFEKTDALIWVVDATDRLRIDDCRDELHGLLQEERLSGASLLIFANKTDVQGCMNEAEILQGLQLKIPAYVCTVRSWRAGGVPWALGRRNARFSKITGDSNNAPLWPGLPLPTTTTTAHTTYPVKSPPAVALVPMSEDVSRFLSQVKELGERRVEEDEARSRELEEKILQDRKERQARRRGKSLSSPPLSSLVALVTLVTHTILHFTLSAFQALGPPIYPRFLSVRDVALETASLGICVRILVLTAALCARSMIACASVATTSATLFCLGWGPQKLIELPSERARSISPQKPSPANTPPPPQPSDSRRLERLGSVASLILYPPTSPQSQPAPDAEEDGMATATPISISPSKENESPLEAEIKPNYPPSPTRAGSTARGLSWQRRPNSQASERSRSRPLSLFAAENATHSSNPTPDARHGYRYPVKRPDRFCIVFQGPFLVPSNPPIEGLVPLPIGETKSKTRKHTVTSSTNLSNAQRLDPPSNNNQSDVEVARETRGPFSPPLGRTSPTRTERPVSPTKGMGGFVQSAMMKRSESVSKRWNVQSPTGLQRVDPTASSRNSYDPAGRASASSKIRPTSVLGVTSPDQARPSSSEGKEEGRPASRSSVSLKTDTATSPEPQGEDSGTVTPPVSPSKTMDPRRWSPQKSSWLESALNKPESPNKPKTTQPPPNQPAWMAEIQKAKAQKASNPGTETSKAPVVSHKHQVSIGGLMRSSAPGMTTTPVGRAANPKPPTLPGPAKPKSEPISETITALPSASKAKPATPPKKDFRATLKARAPPPTAPTSTQQVEFKNVFGNLRRTTTQHYVAPDELKNNIARGKAALAATGGPQKSDRVDELKEAILAKKKEFQAAQSVGRGTARNNSVSSENPIPEGLLKRAELGRSNTIKRDSVISDAPGTESRRPSTISQRDSVPGSLAGRFERFSPLEKRASVIELSNSNPAAQSTSTEPPSVRKLSVPRPTSASTDRTDVTTSPARLPGKISGSALANRFNPALAGLLSRGPPTTSGSRANSAGTSLLGSKTETDDDEAGSGPKLMHMTKNRARGPKRKAPTKSPAPPTTAGESKSSSPKRPRVGDSTIQRGNTTPSSQVNPLDSSEKGYATSVQPRSKPIALMGVSKLATESQASSETNIDRSKPESKIHEQIAVFAAQGQQPTMGKISDEPQQLSPKSPSPGKLNISRISRFADAAPTVDKGIAPEQPNSTETPLKIRSFLDKASTQDVQQKPQPRSPSLNKPKVPLPTPSPLPPKQQHSPRTEAEVIGIESASKVTAPLGPRPLPKPLVLTSSESLESLARSLPKEPERDSRSASSPGLKSPAVTPSPIRSPTKQSLDTSVMLRDFFGSDRPRRDYRVDTAKLLMQRPDSTPSKIQTLSAQLFQLSADGKKQPVPAHHERTLFEQEMYICAHSFNNNTGRKLVEVYFWVGDEVPGSVIEDAEVFVAREARAFGGALVKVRQGKETPEFLQALGGIVITQRGSGNKYDSLAPHMLCGRRYHGHVVFDEVDFTSSALCSGFPYLITQAGRCYLWKGKGSSVDELGCARLIGMDYALSGELEEVEEGNEPAAFWDLFSGARRFGSADHWRLKPNYDKYSSRLFLSDAASKKQIVELSTFSQPDLSPISIYIIDAFFELYIVVGSHAQAEYASFHNALDFAQEYAILAASVEDRPFVPVSTVVLEGIPRDMKSVFRKWQDALSPTITNTNTGLKRGRSLKVVSLGQALQAMSE